MNTALRRLATAVDPVGALCGARAGQGEPFAVQLQPAGELMAVSEPDLVEQVLTGPVDAFLGGHGNATTISLLGPRSVFLAEGDSHEDQRQLVRAVLTAARLTASSRAGDLVGADIVGWPAWRPFPLVLRLRSLLLRAQLPLVVQPSTQHRHAALVHSLDRMLSPLATLGVLSPRPPEESSWPPARLFAARRRSARAVVVEEVRERRRRGEPGEGDVLAALLAAEEHGERLDDQALAYEAVTLLLAATEVPSVALGWAIERLVRSPETVERVVGGDGDLLEAVVTETLRVRPPVLDAFRSLATPVTVNGRSLAAGTTVMAAIPLVHGRAELYEHPQTFCPERFLHRPTPHPPEWVPFGMVPRQCAGRELAHSVMCAVLERVVRLVRLQPVRPGDERQRLLATIVVPDGACLVRVVERRTA